MIAIVEIERVCSASYLLSLDAVILGGERAPRNRELDMVALMRWQKKRGELSLCPDFRLIFERYNYSVSSDIFMIGALVFAFNKKRWWNFVF